MKLTDLRTVEMYKVYEVNEDIFLQDTANNKLPKQTDIFPLCTIGPTGLDKQTCSA